jgi:hypothetical protein
MPELRRCNARSYTDDSPDTSRAICHICEEENTIVYLVKYFMKDGREDKAFRQCPICKKVIPKNQQKHKGEIIALGNTNNSGETSFEAVNLRRGRAFNKRDSDVFDVNDYKLPNGQIDSDLAHYASTGFILNVQDDDMNTDGDLD